jgi:hypothetical protein
VGTITTTIALCTLAAGTQPHSDILSDRVDLIEVNHCYDEKGQLVFDQLLFYDWSPSKSHYDVRDWRLLKSPYQVPRRNHDSGEYVVVWRDGQLMRKVHAKTVRESWTQYDPEIVEQEFLAKEKRRTLPKFSAFRRHAFARPTATENRIATDPRRATAHFHR